MKKAADYILFMRRKNSAHQQDIDDLKRQNMLLESQSKYKNKKCLCLALRNNSLTDYMNVSNETVGPC